MATIHDTTLSPSKLELLLTWLPSQDWYIGPDTPDLRKAGGFRLDDPAGDVGIEFMIVDAVGVGEHITYHVPMTYRGAPLRGGESALIGVATHGVLGDRWIYDGTADPVCTDQLTRLLSGRSLPQHPSRSDEVDASVVVSTTRESHLAQCASVVRVLSTERRAISPSVTAIWKGADGISRSGVVVTR